MLNLRPAFGFLLCTDIIIIIIIITIIQNIKRVTTWPSKSPNRYVKERQCQKYTANEKGECGMYTLGAKSIVPYLSYPASQPWSLSIQWSELHPSPYVLFPQPPHPPSHRSARLCTFQLSSQIRVLTEEFRVPQVTKKLSQFHGTRRFTTVFTKIPSQTNSAHSLSFYFLRIHFNITFLSRDRSSKWYLSLRLSHRSPVRISILHHLRYLPCLAHLPSSDHPVSGAKYKSWSSSLCIFLHSRVPSPVMGENGQKSAFLYLGATVLVGLLIIEDSRSHSDTPQSVGLLWTGDQLVTETFTWQHTKLTTDRHSCPWRVWNPQSQQASGYRPTP